MFARSVYFYGVGRDKKQMEDYVARQKYAKKPHDKYQKTLVAF